MIIELSLMVLSAVVMSLLLTHKHLETNRGTRTVVHDMRDRTDPFLRDIHQTTGQILVGFNLRNVVLVANHIFVSVVRFFMFISHRAHKVSSSIVEKASKKRENLSRSGAASFYLKQIKETKENTAAPRETGIEEEKM